jgi:hypothetical protein
MLAERFDLLDVWLESNASSVVDDARRREAAAITLGRNGSIAFPSNESPAA